MYQSVVKPDCAALAVETAVVSPVVRVVRSADLRGFTEDDCLLWFPASSFQKSRRKPNPGETQPFQNVVQAQAIVPAR